MIDTYRLPTAPQSIGRVLDAGTQLFMLAFPRVVGLALAAQFALFVPQIIASLLGKTLAFDSGTALVMVLYLGATIAFIGPYMGVIVRSWRIANGDDIAAGAAAHAGYRLGLRWLGASIMYSFAIMAGFVLLIVPGIYLAAALSLYFVLLVAENCSARASLSRSRELMRGHWWRAVTILTVPLVLVMIVMLVVEVLPMFVFGMDFSNGKVTASPLLQLLAGTIGALLNGLLTPWTLSVMIALYNDLRLRREGDDLSQRLASLSASA